MFVFVSLMARTKSPRGTTRSCVTPAIAFTSLGKRFGLKTIKLSCNLCHLKILLINHVVGAEKVLDKLLNERTKVGMWQYSEDHHYQLVKAVCVQIKGEIECMLGQWYNSAALLLDSTHGFKSLPEVDKKGLSCSLGLLVNTLQHMSVKEFQFIAQRYSLEARHPYVQAYEFAMEAAELAVYTPLFYARHKVSKLWLGSCTGKIIREL